MRPILTLDVARKILEACIAKAQQEGWKMHVAVIDIGGVGVSGSSAQNDEACAQAGLDAVKDALK